MIWYCPADEEAVDEVDARRLDVDDHLARPRLGVRPLLHPQQRRRTELVADDGTHGRHATVGWWTPSGRCGPTSWRSCRRSRLAADTMFEPLGIGPLPGPGTVEEFAAALVVLVAGDPPVGLCRIDGIGDGAHLEQLSVHPDHGRRGIGRALLRAGCALGRARAATPSSRLATYRDVPWNGPFYASEGFVEVGPGRRLARRPRASDPRSPSCRRFGARVLMRRPL